MSFTIRYVGAPHTQSAGRRKASHAKRNKLHHSQKRSGGWQRLWEQGIKPLRPPSRFGIYTEDANYSWHPIEIEIDPEME